MASVYNLLYVHLDQSRITYRRPSLLSLSLSLSLSVSLVREGTARWADTGLARLMRSRPMRWVTERRVAAVCLSVRPSVYLNER